VNRVIQPWLPEVRKTSKVFVKRKIPQPKLGKLNTPRKFELLYHPFDLRFRGRINSWLKRLTDSKELRLDKVLNNLQLKIVRLYFYPQTSKNIWFNQNKVLKKVKITNKKKLKKELVRSLLEIWFTTRRS
jgi:hypothetical protein